MTFFLRHARFAGALTTALALAALVGAAPAQAHEALASTSPADGQTITANPGKVSITLTAPPTTGIAGANILTVTAPDGHVISSDEVTIDGTMLTTEAEIDHAGEHTVAWRAVSNDGHPIEGKFSFIYAPEDADTGPSGAPASAAPGTGDAAAPASAAATTEPADPAGETAPANITGWLIAASVGIAALAAALLYARNRRHRVNPES